MKKGNKILSVFRYLCLSFVISMGLVTIVGTGGGGGGGGGATPEVTPLLPAGFFAVCEYSMEWDGSTWEPESSTFACHLDGIDTIEVDADLDGDYSDDMVSYECQDDGSFSVATGPKGVFSEDGSLLALTEASDPGYLDLAVVVREGSGMTTDDFDGNFLCTKFAINTAAAVTHTYLAGATTTGYGLGLYFILDSSDPTVIGTGAPFTFTVEDNGNFTLVDSNERGALKADGSMFVVSDVDDTNNIESIMIGLKSSTGLDNTVLQGEYIANLVGRNLFTNELWTARILATFDGVSIARYEFLAHPTSGGGLTGYLIYNVSDTGPLTVQLYPPAGPAEVGIVNSDGSVFTVIDDDPSDGQIYLLLGIKKRM